MCLCLMTIPPGRRLPSRKLQTMNPRRISAGTVLPWPLTIPTKCPPYYSTLQHVLPWL